LPPSFADQLFGTLFLVAILLPFIGHVPLGAAVWRSGVLPRWSGALWIAAQVFMFVLGLVYAIAVGIQSTPPTVPIGALMAVAGGAWMVWSVLRQADSRVQQGLAVR
jgi:predicted phage tail protein